MSKAGSGATPAEPTETPVTAESGATFADGVAEIGADKANPANGREQQIITFSDMKLAVGDRVHIQCPAHMGLDRAFVKVVGYLENTSFIVTAPFRNGVRMDLLVNEILIVRAFSRQSAFAFSCSILRVCKLPFDYLHLSFPRRIQGTVIRKSIRVRAGFAADLGAAPASGAIPDSATIDNISSTGALVTARKPLGGPGGRMLLHFKVQLCDMESDLAVDAKILNITQDEVHAEGACVYRHGVEFLNLQPSDRMIITSFVYQQIIENPLNVL